VKRFLILVKPSRHSHSLSDESLDIPGIRQMVGSVVEQFFKVKIIFFLRNLSTEGSEIWLPLALGGVLPLVAVLRLLRTLLLVLAAGFLATGRYHRS